MTLINALVCPPAVFSDEAMTSSNARVRAGSGTGASSRFIKSAGLPIRPGWESVPQWNLRGLHLAPRRTLSLLRGLAGNNNPYPRGKLLRAFHQSLESHVLKAVSVVQAIQFPGQLLSGFG